MPYIAKKGFPKHCERYCRLELGVLGGPDSMKYRVVCECGFKTDYYEEQPEAVRVAGEALTACSRIEDST